MPSASRPDTLPSLHHRHNTSSHLAIGRGLANQGLGPALADRAQLSADSTGSSLHHWLPLIGMPKIDHAIGSAKKMYLRLRLEPRKRSANRRQLPSWPRPPGVTLADEQQTKIPAAKRVHLSGQPSWMLLKAKKRIPVIIKLPQGGPPPAALVCKLKLGPPTQESASPQKTCLTSKPGRRAASCEDGAAPVENFAATKTQPSL